MNSLSFKDLFSNSRIFYQLDQLCDALIFASDGTQFRVHKLFLSKASDYFLAFFRTKFGNQDDIIHLPFESNILHSILLFIYTGEVHLTDSNIADMIIAADYLLINSLLMHCKHFVSQRISLDCCVALLAAASIVERLGLFDFCYRFVLVHFGRLVQRHNSPIADLSLETLKSLLKDDSLCVLDESIVLRAIVIWVEKNEADRLPKVQKLLSCLRRPIDFSSSNGGSNSVIEIILHQNQKSTQLSMTFNRYPRTIYICLCRRVYPKNITEVFITYDEQLDIWRKIGETDANFHTLISVNKLVFLFNTMTNIIKVFDLVEKEWRDKEGIQTSRQSYFVVKNNQRIYLVGGYNFMSNLQVSNIEYYESTMDFWVSGAHVPPMIICGASVVNDELYIVGYDDDPEKLEMRAAAYKETQDAWIEINHPKVFRTQFAMLGFYQYVFIFGGRTEENIATVVTEFYDPEKDAWRLFQDLPFPYELPQAVAIQNKIMVYDDCPPIAAVPRFSPCVWNDETEKWELVDVFSHFNEIHRYSFCCLEDQDIITEMTKENRDQSAEWLKTPFVDS